MSMFRVIKRKRAIVRPKNQSIFSSTPFILLAMCLCLAIAFNEYLVYLWYASSWTLPRLPDSAARGDSVRVLLVADPQIQGFHYEPPVFGYLTRLDVERYLRHTFSYALDFTNPDVIIFLGDLMDEGSTSTDEEFIEYATKFKDIYAIPNNIKKIYLPGDNDIGGEGNDPITKAKVDRFQKEFGEITKVTTYKNIDFIQMFHLLENTKYPSTNIVQQSFIKTLKEVLLESKGTIRIILSHFPLFSFNTKRRIRLLKDVKPQYAFTAHSHYSKIFRHDVKELIKSMKKSFPEIPNLVDPDENYPVTWERLVPTCSYRMGVQSMAFAVALVGSDGTMEFKLLPLPPRYYNLVIYLCASILVLTFTFIHFCC